jgi:hypothetical protein
MPVQLSPTPSAATLDQMAAVTPDDEARAQALWRRASGIPDLIHATLVPDAGGVTAPIPDDDTHATPGGTH